MKNNRSNNNDWGEKKGINCGENRLLSIGGIVIFCNFDRDFDHVYFVICLKIRNLDCGQNGQGQEGQEGFGTEFCSL